MGKYLDGVKRLTLLLFVISLIVMTVNISFRTLEIPKPFETFATVIITYYFTNKKDTKKEDGGE